MTQEKHTPGPWLVIPRGESSGKCVGTIEPKPETMLVPNYWTVASVNGLRDEWEANLSLIAAAPELLEALKQFIDEKVDYMRINNLGDPEQTHTVKWGRAAIAKAEAQS